MADSYLGTDISAVSNVREARKNLNERCVNECLQPELQNLQTQLEQDYYSHSVEFERPKSEPGIVDTTQVWPTSPTKIIPDHPIYVSSVRYMEKNGNTTSSSTFRTNACWVSPLHLVPWGPRKVIVGQINRSPSPNHNPLTQVSYSHQETMYVLTPVRRLWP